MYFESPLDILEMFFRFEVLCYTSVLFVDELQYQSDGNIWNQGQQTGHVWGGQSA